ncbi:MAG: HAD family hydrolase [Planctomycetes bacterium]|nr:HAD family hydrolase [Planctomycetota bacterium]
MKPAGAPPARGRPGPARIALFDIDGTLLLAGGAGRRALDRLFERRYGVVGAAAGIRPHGMTDPAILRQMLCGALGRSPAAGELEALALEYVELLGAEIADAPGFRLMPGLPDLLERLAAHANLHLGLATGNLARAAQLKLSRGGIDRYFAFGGFGSDAEDRSELTRIACARGRARARDGSAPAYVIGDTVHDVRAARAAGAECLAVLTTGASPEALRQEGARRVLEDLRDTAAVLDFLGVDGS